MPLSFSHRTPNGLRQYLNSFVENDQPFIARIIFRNGSNLWFKECRLVAGGIIGHSLNRCDGVPIFIPEVTLDGYGYYPITHEDNNCYDIFEFKPKKTFRYTRELKELKKFVRHCS